jgi:hypothetical protein
MHNDVTAGYIVSDVERLRRPMHKITDYILKRMGIMHTTKPAKNNPINDVEGNVSAIKS